MKRIAVLPAMLAVAVFAEPLTWEKLVESAKNDPRYEHRQKQQRHQQPRGGAEAFRGYFGRTEYETLGQVGTPLPA